VISQIFDNGLGLGLGVGLGLGLGLGLGIGLGLGGIMGMPWKNPSSLLKKIKVYETIFIPKLK